MVVSDTRTPPPSQTLSRGLRIIEVLSENGPLTIDELADRLGVHRSIAYRLLRTLESHALVARDSSGRVSLGPRMAALAAGVERDLQSQALPELTLAANELGMTCFLAVLDHDECITLTSVEPRHTVASVAQRPGARHPITVGAPSKAMLSTMPPSAWPTGVDETLRSDIDVARSQGYATSHDEVIPTVQSVAVPLPGKATHRPAAIAVIYVASTRDTSEIAARLVTAASAISESLGG